MSILIKGMEMPKNGTVVVILPDGTVQDMFFHNVLGKAVEIPPHGRLIDGDELAAGCDDPYWCRWLSEINDAPTVISAEKAEEE